MLAFPVPSPTFESALRSGTATLLAVAPTLPREPDIECELEDARRAAERGYFLPDEDERAYRLILEAGLSAEIWGFSRAIKAERAATSLECCRTF